MAGNSAIDDPVASGRCVVTSLPARERPRTIVTTDGEVDDMNSFRRLLYYANDLDIAGLVYSSSVHHWRGDGERTLDQAVRDGILSSARGEMAGKLGPSNDEKSWRWEPLGWMEDIILRQYASVYVNLVRHDAVYPYPAELWSKVAVGNIDFENDFAVDTAGSDLIKSALLDADQRKLYLQAWGGMNSIARALKSIEDEFSTSDRWNDIRRRVTAKAVIVTIGHQDNAYDDYIVKSWPGIVVYDLGEAFGGFTAFGARVADPGHVNYFEAPWWPDNIKYGHGSLLQDYVLFGDGSFVRGEGDNPNWQPGQARDMASFRLFDFVGPVKRLDWVAEGDTPAYLFLLASGFRSIEDPSLGGWSGRLAASGERPNYFTSQGDILPGKDQHSAPYGIVRWIDAIQNDFAARADWGITSNCGDANHAPSIKIDPGDVSVSPGEKVEFSAIVHDPDGEAVSVAWSTYDEASSATDYALTGVSATTVRLEVSTNSRAGQRVVLIAAARDTGTPALTRYAEVVVSVK